MVLHGTCVLCACDFPSAVCQAVAACPSLAVCLNRFQWKVLHQDSSAAGARPLFCFPSIHRLRLWVSAAVTSWGISGRTTWTVPPSIMFTWTWDRIFNSKVIKTYWESTARVVLYEIVMDLWSIVFVGQVKGKQPTLQFYQVSCFYTAPAPAVAFKCSCLLFLIFCHIFALTAEDARPKHWLIDWLIELRSGIRYNSTLLESEDIKEQNGFTLTRLWSCGCFKKSFSQAIVPFMLMKDVNSLCSIGESPALNKSRQTQWVHAVS